MPGWASDSVLMSSPLDFILQVQLFPLGKLVGLAGLVPFPPFALEVMSVNALERKWMERKPFQGFSVGYICPFLEDYFIFETCFQEIRGWENAFLKYA